jgi:hypothetical protein
LATGGHANAECFPDYAVLIVAYMVTLPDHLLLVGGNRSLKNHRCDVTMFLPIEQAAASLTTIASGEIVIKIAS